MLLLLGIEEIRWICSPGLQRTLSTKKKRVNGQTFINSAIHSATDDKAVRVNIEAISYRASFSHETFCMVLFAISISLFPWKGGGS